MGEFCRFALPARDGLRIDEEEAGGLGPLETVGLHQDHDLESFLRSVVLALSGRETHQASPHNLGNGALLLELDANEHMLGKAGADRAILLLPLGKHVSETQREVPGA